MRFERRFSYHVLDAPLRWHRKEDLIVEERPIYDFAGGRDAFVALAAALHERCLADPVLNHPFSHATDPEHLDHLADYIGEVFGGPATYSTHGGHSHMLAMHASTGADPEMAIRFVN